MTVRLLVGDVHERLADIPDHSVDLIACSPPFWGQRDYGGPSKLDAEMGSEPDPAAFLDNLLDLTVEFRRVLTPHGSIAVELGDTYFGSGGAGGDYNDDGLREGQTKFRQKRSNVLLPKSLCLIPTLYPASLAYGWNMLNPAHTFDRWRVRNLIVWARPNPPVGQLTDRVRTASTYITVACTSAKRWFDLDAVRTPLTRPEFVKYEPITNRIGPGRAEDGAKRSSRGDIKADAPPLDWWNLLADRVDAALRQAAKGELTQADLFGGEEKVGKKKQQKETAGGKLLREAWEAGEVVMPDFFPMSTQPYKGAHYATWPEKLAARLIEMMCPRQVCVTCGEPSTRIVGLSEDYAAHKAAAGKVSWTDPGTKANRRNGVAAQSVTRENVTLRWSDCGHNTWRPGMILDPFAGSGTTLAVAQGLGRDCTGIELYPANAELCRRRVGMFLEVDGDTQPAPIVDVADIDLWDPHEDEAV